MPDPKEQERKAPDPEQFVLTDEAFKDHVRKFQEFTLEYIRDNPREGLMPHLLVVTKDVEGKEELTVCGLAVPFNETKEKHSVLFNLGKKFFEDKKIVLAVILSSEAWSSKRPKDGDWQDVQPRHDPLKTESILVAGAAMNPKQRMVILTPFKRDADNNIVIDGESDESMEAEFFLINHFWQGYLSKFKQPK